VSGIDTATRLEVLYSFSPDRRRLAIARAANGGSGDIFTVPVEVESGQGALGFRLGKAELFLGTPFNEALPAFSPDGRWLAYTSDESYARSPGREDDGKFRRAEATSPYGPATGVNCFLRHPTST